MIFGPDTKGHKSGTTKGTVELTVMLIPLQFVIKPPMLNSGTTIPGIFCNKYTCLLVPPV